MEHNQDWDPYITRPEDRRRAIAEILARGYLRLCSSRALARRTREICCDGDGTAGPDEGRDSQTGDDSKGARETAR